ncbi:MAG: hypothetical protein IT280_01430 [Ignavibacteria bacterium]|nr:hypothetical protein [Ignavibacteria bacterium]
MKISFSVFMAVIIFTAGIYSQNSAGFKLKENRFSLKNPVILQNNFNADEKTDFKKNFQLKKRKTVTSYFGAGYSFMIFTNSFLSSAFPILDTRNGSFLTNINLFFGFAIAKAVTLEISPSILFTNNNRQVNYHFPNRYNTGSNNYLYGHTFTNGLIALPIVINVRFFPMFKRTDFARLFFIGGGAGFSWIREENDVNFNDNPYSNNSYYGNGEYISGMTTSQWAPIFKAMAGFTGTGGQFGFGGEVSYNFVPLKQDITKGPFATRFAKDMNSVDITLRFYFSL